MEKIAGLDCSGVTQKRLFQRSSLPPWVSNDPFVCFHSPSLVTFKLFHGEKRKASKKYPRFVCCPARASRNLKGKWQGHPRRGNQWDKRGGAWEGPWPDIPARWASECIWQLPVSNGMPIPPRRPGSGKVYSSASGFLVDLISVLWMWFSQRTPPPTQSRLPSFGALDSQELKICHDLQSFLLFLPQGDVPLTISLMEALALLGRSRSQKPQCKSAPISIFTLCLETSATQTLLLGYMRSRKDSQARVLK